MAVANPVTAHPLAASGLGIAMLPSFITRQDKGLISTLPDWHVQAVDFFALFPARQLTPLKLLVFLDELEQNLKI